MLLLLLRSATGVWVVANGKRVLNMASLNFLGFAGDPTIQVRGRATTACAYSSAAMACLGGAPSRSSRASFISLQPAYCVRSVS